MASGAVWGIDIGQCALKALRCRTHEDGRQVIADAFDYIEYPKVLSQPGSDPAELIGEALKQFLSRNSVIGDQVAISVSGQAGLARFIKLPPVEAKKIPDIVRYEARQQIPFDLNDVIWDYQRMGIGSEEEGFALETEIGLFAMKRDAVLRALEPFVRAGIEVDIVQLTPLVLYNFALFDQLNNLPAPEEYDPENPPESLALVSLGTDATDLVITNGYRVWQRSIPLGGNHFTKALTRELKLTFAKAEHLKRNATAAADPKAVFQAMRPVFSDLLTELQRSIGYFSNLDRSAKIGRVVALGNAMKLPGLRRYLSQSLDFEIEKLDSFNHMTGSQVVSAPAFQDNLLSFATAYGLALQGLAKGGVHTNLLPKEIVQERLIRRKKPWAIAAAAAFLMGCTLSYGAYSWALSTVDTNRWSAAESQAKQLKQKADTLKNDATAAEGKFKGTDEIGQHLISNIEGRVQWLELLKAVNECLPKPEEPKADADAKADAKSDTKETEASLAETIAKRNELFITNLDCQRAEDVATWYAGVKRWDATAASAADSPAPSGAGGAAAAQGEATGPTGAGWIVHIVGHHYHNDKADSTNYGAQFVEKTLIEKLRNGTLKLPSIDGEEVEDVTMQELGISRPVLINPTKVETEDMKNPNAESEMSGGALGPTAIAARPGSTKRPGTASGDPSTVRLQRFDFVVHFCWQPKTPNERKKAKDAIAAQKAAETPAPAANN